MIYITGDMHGDISRFSKKELRAPGKRDTLLICGDFGFLWEGGKAEERLIRRLGRRPYDIAFVDGTHENFDLLERCESVTWNGGQARRLTGNLYHMMRGQIYTIEDRRFFAFGGGHSLEVQVRSDQNHWWEREMPTGAEMEEGLANLRAAGMRVDYIITHEPGAKLKRFLNISEDAVSALNVYFDQIAQTCDYKRWFFGSCHLDKIISQKQIGVYRAVLPVDMSQSGRR